mgnify:CR=1 FL=1|jgi:ribonuclease P protein component
MLPRDNRISSRAIFQKVIERGKRRENQYFRIFFTENYQNISRFAVIISSKVCPSAVKRNLIKRRIRNIIKSLIPLLPSGFDVLIFVKKDCLEITFQQMKNQLEEFLIKVLKD